MKSAYRQQSTQSRKRIARAKLGVETLETRSSDEPDLHGVGVWQLRAALQAAFEAARTAKKNER